MTKVKPAFDWPKVSLSEVLRRAEETVARLPDATYRKVTVKLWGKGLLNGCAPAEADMQRFFRVTPPSVHQMVLTLERRGFLRRVPGQARSITLCVRSELLPPLQRAQDRAGQRGL